MNTYSDPHHPEIEWRLIGKTFYHRNKYCKKWQQMNKSHLTPARIKVMYEMVMEEERCNSLIIKDKLCAVVV